MEPPSTSAIHILNRTSKRIRVHRVREAVEAALSNPSTRQLTRSSAVEILLTDDDEIQALNSLSRGIDEPTDVLSFPAPEFPEAPLGEIAISLDYAERQALARGISLEDELCYLAIHGALHLLGMDDIEPDERSEMFAAMHRVGMSIGLPEQPEWMSILSEQGTGSSSGGEACEVPHGSARSSQ